MNFIVKQYKRCILVLIIYILLPFNYEAKDNSCNWELEIDNRITGQTRVSSIDPKVQIVQPVYHNAYEFSEGLVAVQKFEEGLWGFLDIKGKEAIPLNYKEVRNFSEGLASVEIGETFNEDLEAYSFIDKNGKLVPNLKFPIINGIHGRFSEGFVSNLHLNKDKASETGNIGFYNKSGKLIFLVPVAEIISLEVINGITYGMEYNENTDSYSYRFYDAKGKQLSKNSFDDIYGYFREGFTAVKKDGLWGYVNSKLETVIPFQFAEAGRFWNGLAPVVLPGKSGVGFINKKGEIVINPIYEKTRQGQDEVISVFSNGKWKIIDNKGNDLFEFGENWEELNYFWNSISVYQKNGKSGLVHVSGKILTKPLFDEIIRGDKPYLFTFKLNGKFGFINSSGCF